MKVYSYFVKARQRADGMYPVYIVISRPQGRITVNSGLASSTIFIGNIFPRSEANSRSKTARLTSLMNEIEDIALNNSRLNNAELKELINKKVFFREEKKTLADYLREKAGLAKASRTGELYRYTANKVEKFDKYADLNIDHNWLARFDDDMAKELSANARSIHTRNIRSVFNWAIDNNLTENYPFRKFKIKREATRKRNLSADLIGQMASTTYPKPLCEYVDFFLLSFYLIGVNPIDILKAEKSQIVDGRFEYIRAKTHKLYSIKIEPEAKDIIERYKGEELLLSFCENRSMDAYLQKVNKGLKEIRAGMTTYYCRHSWASIASEIDIPIDTISEALGHSHGAGVTNVYINFSQKKVDVANRKVIDYVLK